MSPRPYRPGPRHDAEHRISSTDQPEVKVLRLPGREIGSGGRAKLVEVPLISTVHPPTLRHPELTESTLEPVEAATSVIPHKTRVLEPAPGERAAPSLGNAEFKAGVPSTESQVHNLYHVGRRIGAALNRARGNKDTASGHREGSQDTVPIDTRVSWDEIRDRNYTDYYDHPSEASPEVRERYRQVLENEAFWRSNGYPVTTMFGDYSERATGPENGVVEPKRPWSTQNEIGTVYLFDQMPTVTHAPVDPHHKS